MFNLEVSYQLSWVKNMSTVKIGVIGCAKIASRSVIPAINKLNTKFKLVGIASREKLKAKNFAKKFNTIPFDDYEKLITSGGCEAVYIPLPTALNGEYAKLALANNLHVLVEKTMSNKFDVVKELNSLAKMRNVSLIENFQFRFHNQLDDIIQIIQSGEIGDIRCLNSSFGFPPFTDKQNIRYSSALGGGALHDVGCYTIKIAQIILGLNINVLSSTLYFDNNINLWGGGLLECPVSKKFAQISFGFDNHYRCSLDLWGSDGRLSSKRIFTPPPEMSPEIRIEKSTGIKKFISKKCNHFEKILDYFYKSIFRKNIREREYIENINQARLINEVKQKA